MANAGSITVGVKVIDGQADVTQYVERAQYDRLRAEVDDLRARLQEAEALADDWESRYEDLLASVGGTTSP